MDWREIEVAGDGTHHVRDGRPVYVERYDEVLKFHAPGLAPVRGTGGAFHIDAMGRPAYLRRFVRTFGFYEERAAVQAADGWHHIHVDGADLYTERHRWCGNYQCGRVTVSAANGHFLHLDQSGVPLYVSRWRYAGDYRDGIAVVQMDDGRSTHIDGEGEFVHGCCFLDLDVFHKGFARARDTDGWMHVDRRGRPAYPRRFAAVEPFYNGQARVERFDGAFEIITESGVAVVQLRAPTMKEISDDQMVTARSGEGSRE